MGDRKDIERIILDLMSFYSYGIINCTKEGFWSEYAKMISELSNKYPYKIADAKILEIVNEIEDRYKS